MSWELVDAYERLGSRAASVFSDDVAAWVDYATDTVEDLEPWPAGRPFIDIYQNRGNRTRFRRLLDYTVAGDRMVDIGLGHGYQTGLFIRDGRPSTYLGMDLIPKHVKACEQMMAVNGLDHSNVQLRQGDLYHLSPETTADATFIVCCEVLEHLPDPEQALRVLAQALPHNADLLISVPMYRRLDGVWGHRNVFDTTRLRMMIADAGLKVHRVEPLANTWVLALLAHHSEPCERAALAASRGPVRPRLAEYTDFTTLDLTSLEAVEHGRRATATVERTKKGVVCRVSSKRGLTGGAGEGGVGFPVPGLNAMRLHLELPDIADIEEFSVCGYVGTRAAVRWYWSPKKRPLTSDTKMFVLYADKSGMFFQLETSTTPSKVDRAEVLVNPRSGRSAEFVVRRIAAAH